MYEDDREESEQEILDEEDQHEDKQPVTTRDKAWGFWHSLCFLYADDARALACGRPR